VSAKKIVVSFFHAVDKALLLLLETDTHPKLSSHGQMVTMAEGGSIATRSHSWKQSTFNENVVVLIRPVVSHVLICIQVPLLSSRMNAEAEEQNPCQTSLTSLLAAGSPKQHCLFGYEKQALTHSKSPPLDQKKVLFQNRTNEPNTPLFTSTLPRPS
jgi:hypothetical protein